MKYNLIFLLALLIFSCNKDSKVEAEPMPAVLPELVGVNELRSLLPQALIDTGQRFAIFIDMQNVEHKVKVEVMARVVQWGSPAGNYEAERHLVLYRYEEKNVFLHIDIGANVSDGDLSPVQGLLVDDDNSLSLGGVLIPYNYETKSTKSVFTKVLDEISLLGKTFKDVYLSSNQEEFTYQELRFNFEHGIVSFGDKEGNVYVFDRFE